MIITFLIVGPVLVALGVVSIRPFLKVQPTDASYPFWHKSGIVGSTAAIFVGNGLTLAGLDMLLRMLAQH